jgi:hypothetical protein
MQIGEQGIEKSVHKYDVEKKKLKRKENNNNNNNNNLCIYKRCIFMAPYFRIG